MAPDCVTEPPAVSTVDAPVLIDDTAKPLLSVYRTVPVAPVFVSSLVVEPAVAVSAALRIEMLSVATLLSVAVNNTPAPELFSVLTVSVLASTDPVPKALDAAVEMTPLDVKVTVPADCILATLKALASK